jgi:phosphate transport system permease protein
MLRTDKGFTIATLTGDSLVVDHVAREENEFTGETKTSVKRYATAVPDAGAGTRVLVTNGGSGVCVIDAAGSATLVDATTPELTLIASGNVGKGAAVSAATMLIGGNTVLVGDQAGNITSWFTAESNGRKELVNPRVYRGRGAAVTTMAASARERLFAAGYADGRVRIFQATSGRRVIDTTVEPRAAIDAIAFAPKTDGLLVAAGSVAAALQY